MLGYSWRGDFRGYECLMGMTNYCGWDSFVGKCHNLISNFFEKRIVILIDMSAPVCHRHLQLACPLDSCFLRALQVG
jgi:hypothetical protein